VKQCWTLGEVLLCVGVTCKTGFGFAIGYIDYSLYNHSQSQQITIVHDKSSAEPFFLGPTQSWPDLWINSALIPDKSQFEKFYLLPTGHSAGTILISNWLHLKSSRVESYVTTDGQSARLSSNKAPIRGLRPDFYYCQTVAGLLMWSAFSDERTGLSFTIAAGLASTVIFGSESRGIRDHILLFQIRDFPLRRLLQLAGLRWRYSTPPPHRINLVTPV
jgi:hypothetical protein